MVGMARKNENSAAARLSAPSSIAPTMVAPERETPGTMARHWKSPILQVHEQRKARRVVVRRLELQVVDHQQHEAARDQGVQTSQGLNSTSLMKPCSPAPITAAGRNARSTPMTKRRASGS